MRRERSRVRTIVSDIVHLEGLRKAPQQADEMLGGLGKRLALGWATLMASAA